MSNAMYRVAAALLALGIFLFDVLAPLEGAVAVFYVLVVLAAARTASRFDVLVASLAAIGLTALAYVLQHGMEPLGSPALRALVSLAAILIATVLALQSQSATATLSAHARLLNLSHDMIFVRDIDGRIRFWNVAAEHAYGWSAAEANGRVADELLQTRYRAERAEVETALLHNGRWEGLLEQRTRSGARLVLDSRWALQRGRRGEPVGVLETHTDVTDREAAHSALVRSERRYRRMFDAGRVGVLEEDWSAVRAELAAGSAEDTRTIEPALLERARRSIRIVDANAAFLSMVGVEDAPQFLRTVDDILVRADRTLAGALAAFARGDAFHEGETELVGRDGRIIPVLFAITFPAPDDACDHVLVHVVDITERRLAHDALEQARAELAHATRVATLGELSASIAHEVSQPLMAVVTNGEAGLRWLRREPPEAGEVGAALERVVAEARRATEIVRRIRAFLAKAPSQRAPLVLPALVEDAVALVRRELVDARVQLHVDVPTGLPPVLGDRVQLQQVLVNLIVNATQAMAGQSRPRVLSISASAPSTRALRLELRDTGPGIAPEHAHRLFEPFFSTKRDGMGMGLAICRTTTEAHGGRLELESEPGGGALFRITLPVGGATAATAAVGGAS